jgi:hypothetical protein
MSFIILQKNRFVLNFVFSQKKALILEPMPIFEEHLNDYNFAITDQGYLMEIVTVVKIIDHKTYFQFLKLFDITVNT